MSDMPLTLPNPTQPPTVDVVPPGMNVKRSRASGITLREPEEMIRLSSPRCHFREKEKGIISHSTSTENSDSSDDAAAVVPDVVQPVPEVGEYSRRIQRQLFPNPQCIMEDDVPTSNVVVLERNEAEPSSGFGSQLYWSRYQAALTQMITAGTKDPALFGRMLCLYLTTVWSMVRFMLYFK